MRIRDLISTTRSHCCPQCGGALVVKEAEDGARLFCGEEETHDVGGPMSQVEWIQLGHESQLATMHTRLEERSVSQDMADLFGRRR